MAAQRMLDGDSAAPGFCSCSAELHLSDGPPSPQRSTRVGVADEITVFRGALSRELQEHGLEVVSLDRMEARATVDLSVCGISSEQDWSTLEQMLGDTPVFAIVPEPFEDNKVRALGLGAAGASARNAALPEIVSAICAIPRGYMLIDLDLLQRLCLSLAPEPPFQLSQEEREWLRRLAEGATIAAVAKDRAYSEREMHRVMRRLYERMDVANLYQALIEATRYRLLD